MKKGSFLIGICASMIAYSIAEVHSEPNVVLPDLTFQFVCNKKDRTALEDDIEKFMRRQSFNVLNQARIQREHGVFLKGVEIIGLDRARRVIEVSDLPPSQDRYAVVLNSPPPTKHDPQLEAALLEFASKILGCEVRHVARGENGIEAASAYNDVVSRIEGLFRQAEELQGDRRL